MQQGPPPKDEIRRLILEQGFDRVGFAPVGPTPRSETFREWLRRGYAGSMGYLGRSIEKPEDPRRILPGTRTVICAAVHYRGSARSSGGAPPVGEARISTYSRGSDYHRVLGRRLRAASESLRERTGGEFRWYVDTGPVLEKAWAERAGLGWIGKNTCAIDPDRGSYFFLGTILSTLEVPPDDAAVDHCGSCRRCIAACPTGAIVEPYVLDARRCISYLTIEERGPIRTELARSCGSWVFGCDICQEVCPYNGAEPRSGDRDLAPRAENAAPRLSELSALSEPEFRSRFRGSPVLRARFEGFLRNVAIAAGNAPGIDAVRILDAMRKRPELMRHPAAARAILESLAGRGSTQEEGDRGSRPADDSGPAPESSS